MERLEETFQKPEEVRLAGLILGRVIHSENLNRNISSRSLK